MKKFELTQQDIQDVLSKEIQLASKPTKQGQVTLGYQPNTNTFVFKVSGDVYGIFNNEKIALERFNNY